MDMALACASHTPMLLEEAYSDAATCAKVSDSYDQLARFVRDFAPEQVIQFSPDHYHGFHYDNMPSFCIGAAARSYGDWNTATGALRVDEDFALDMLDAVRAANIDAAVSFDMIVDHGFVQIWEAMLGGFDVYPIVPVFVNAIAYPLPTYRRARLLGEAVGRFAQLSGRRVLFVASGGLSHDPVIPMIRGAPPEVRDRLIGRTAFTPEQQAHREIQGREAARLAMTGEGPSRPLNPEWDRALLETLARADWATTDSFTAESVDAVAGAGGNEILCWVAATAALATAGSFVVVQKDYIDVPGWIAGMAHFAARRA